MLGPERRSFQDRPVAVADLRHSCYSVRYSLWRDLGTPSESLVVPTPEAACWVHGLTASVSGQNRCLGMGMSVASAACGGSLMFATVCAGWPTVWPTASRLTSVGSTAAPASCRSRASDRAHRRIARPWRCPREPSREIDPAGPPLHMGPSRCGPAAHQPATRCAKPGITRTAT
jgi:hypothetical protein